MSVDQLVCFVAGAAVGAVLAVVVVVSYARAFPYDCQESGGFVHDNQYYECRPTGEWVE